ncbi:hypothetical protein QYE76_003137 [Lolium multiflorum]|uniref:Uncharacterized protein n=1 Tax=Lolium multiflorum TaxID=4521 RepID=A0AAD8RQA3_LOLMU|nr:hypothetical protein QYE76_003137 [Lolium multiflorum]
MADDGGGDVPPPPPPPPPSPLIANFFEEQHEEDPRESEESEYITALLSGEDPPDFSKVMQPLEINTQTESPEEDAEPADSARNTLSSVNGSGSVVRTPTENRDSTLQLVQQNPQLLENLLQDGAWDDLLKLLEHRVIIGDAETAVVDADPSDIYAAHPELVLLLLRQRYFDLRRYGQTAEARVYYRDQIEARYPQGTSTGSTFADSTILEELHTLSRTVFNQVGHCMQERAETRQAIRDYLQLYFPAFRPNVQEAARPSSRIWEMGEKIGRDGRCLACHKFFVELTPKRLRQHLEGLGEGGMGRCAAVTKHVLGRLRAIEDTMAAAAGPAIPPPDADDAHDAEAASVGSSIPPPNADDAHHGEAATAADAAGGAGVNQNASDQEGAAPADSA